MTVIVLAITILFTLIIYRIFIQRIIREKNQKHDLEIRYRKDLLEQSVKIQERERERIAVNLHDVVGNKLNVLSVWLNNPDTWNSERSREIVAKQIPELIEATRNISHSMYPVNLERFGLIVAIEELTANIESSLTVRLILIHEYQPKEITSEVQLYRIIQEFLSNVIAHSEANEMIIHIRDSVKSLCLVLSDNGKGFNIESVKKGMGLGNIELRLKSMDAFYKWKSKPGEGSRLIVVIPKI